MIRFIPWGLIMASLALYSCSGSGGSKAAPEVPKDPNLTPGTQFLITPKQGTDKYRVTIIDNTQATVTLLRDDGAQALSKMKLTEVPADSCVTTYEERENGEIDLAPCELDGDQVDVDLNDCDGGTCSSADLNVNGEDVPADVAREENGGGGGGGGSGASSIVIFPPTLEVSLCRGKKFDLVGEPGSPADGRYTWYINDIQGGNFGTLGSIDSQGYYLPPEQIPANPVITVRVVDNHNPGRSGTATVTIVGLTMAPIRPVSASLGPNLSAWGFDDPAPQQIAIGKDELGAPRLCASWVTNPSTNNFDDAVWSSCADPVETGAFGGEIQISPTNAGHNRDGITIASDHRGYLYASYCETDNRLLFSKSTDGGRTWAPEITVREDDVGHWLKRAGCEHAMAVDGHGSIYIAANALAGSIGQGNGNIAVLCSNDGGNTWLTMNEGITGSAHQAARFPDMAIDSNNFVHVVWMDDRPIHGEQGGFDIYYSKSTIVSESGCVAGMGFSPSLKVNHIATQTVDDDDFEPAIVWKGSAIHVTWFAENQGNQRYKVYYSRKYDGQPEFTPAVLVDPAAVAGGHGTPGHQSPVTLEVTDNHIVYVGWKDSRADEAGNFHRPYVAKSCDNGQTFKGPFHVNTDAARQPIAQSVHEVSMITDAYGQVHFYWYNAETRKGEARSTELRYPQVEN